MNDSMGVKQPFWHSGGTGCVHEQPRFFGGCKSWLKPLSTVFESIIKTDFVRFGFSVDDAVFEDVQSLASLTDFRPEFGFRDDDFYL